MDVVPAIAFRNGTYMIQTGELVDHSPAFKLTFSIPGDYIPNAECPPVMQQYLEHSFGTAWIGIIRCILRYLVDQTTFKPHKFVVVIGKSGSGKGVFERLCCQMFPPTSISCIAGGVKAIGSTEKQNQLVAGKKLVTWPDMQGHQRDVSALYALTDEGFMSSRTLFVNDPEAAPFTGRVVICSTQALNMENAGNGMERRMLTLPTQGSTGKPDPELSDKLKAELGQIMSWAMGASVAEVNKVICGDVELIKQTNLEAVSQMDPVRLFIDECLKPAEGDTLISNSSLYSGYKQYCDIKGLKPLAENNFKGRLRDALDHLVLKKNGHQKTALQIYGIGWSTDPHKHFPRGPFQSGGVIALANHRPNPPSYEAIRKHQKEHGA
mgnify:CR=1 FL=1